MAGKPVAKVDNIFHHRAKSEEKKALVKYLIELVDSAISEIRLSSSRNVMPLQDVDLRELLQNLVNSKFFRPNENYF